MALRGKKPTTETRRLKVLVYGPPGSGKTYLACHMPRVYMYDAERGAEQSQYVEALIRGGGVTFQTTNFAEVNTDCRSLLTEKHDYATLVIDPVTVIFGELIDRCEKKYGSDWGRHNSEAVKEWNRLMYVLYNLDMNIVIIAHAKGRWEGKGKAREQVGLTFDGPKGLDHQFDLVLETNRDEYGVRTVQVQKTRLPGFADLERFPMEYAELEKRCGPDLNRDAVPIELATPDQVIVLTEALAIRKDGDDLLAKWLSKAKAEAVEDLPRDVATKCIEFLGGGK